MHATRADAMVAGVNAFLHGASLAVTALGRHLDSPALTKHHIKRMDRLLSHPHLHSERPARYSALCHPLCRGRSRPIILVDWSDLVEQNRVLLIRAALVVEGRALPRDESIFPLKPYNSPRTHGRLLQELKDLLPQHCRPLVVTDAGFRGPWFQAVQALGWDGIGRIRHGINYRLKSCSTWRKTTALSDRATSTPQDLGAAARSNNHPDQCHLHLVKKRSRHRQLPRSVRHHGQHSTSAVVANQPRDPWLIATSLPPDQYSTADSIAL